MADLTEATYTDVAIVEMIEGDTVPAGEAIIAGRAVGLNSSGKAVLADADTGPIECVGIACNGANVAGLPVTIMRKGKINLGSVLGATAFEAPIYPSGTAGKLSDSQVNSRSALGSVEPAWAATTADKILRVTC